MLYLHKFSYRILFQLAAIAVISLIISTQYINKPPRYDEFYHINAANSYLDRGDFSILQGKYERARLFTWMVSQSIGLFGDNLVSARLPSLLFGMLLVCCVFLWVLRYFGSPTAWIASLLLSVSPILVSNMQFSRFYTLHALLFFVFFILSYHTVTHWSRLETKKIISILFCTIAFVLACYFQITTLIGAMFVGIWCLSYLFYKNAANNMKTVSLFIFSVITLGVISISLLYSELTILLESFNNYSLWAEESVNNMFAYIYTLKRAFPILTILLPISIFISIYKKPGISAYMTIVFTGGIILHSLAAMKSERYILYLTPLFFILSAIAITQFAKLFYFIILDIYKNNLQHLLPNNNFLKHLFLVTCTALTLTYIVQHTNNIKSAPDIITKKEYIEPYTRNYTYPDWRLSATFLKNYAKDKDVIIASAGIKAIYYIGTLSYDLNSSVLDEVGKIEYSTDPRTGVKVISKIDSIKSIISTNKSGLIIIDSHHYKSKSGVTVETTNYIETHLRKIETPLSPNIYVFDWGS